MKTTLRPLQIKNLIKDVIDESMTGNEGLAIAKMRRKAGLEPTNELYSLNDKLVQIELDARKKMKAAIEEFLES